MSNLLQILHKVYRIRPVVLYNKAVWKQEKTLFCAAPLLLLFLLCARLLFQCFLLLRHLFVPQPLKCLGTPSGYSREGQRLGGDGGGVGGLDEVWGCRGTRGRGLHEAGEGQRERTAEKSGGTWLFSITLINGGGGRGGELE